MVIRVRYLPWQLCSSSDEAYPGSQMQMNFPSIFSHLPVLPQTFPCTAHSSISVKKFFEFIRDNVYFQYTRGSLNAIQIGLI